MSVSDTDDMTATSGADDGGVPPHLLTEADFIGVRAALVRHVGNDGNRALVLTRILWRADRRWREAVEADEQWWWRATYDTIADETGLSRKQVERCLKWLVDEGMVAAEAHHVDGPYDQTRSYRVIVANLPESGDDIPESGNVHRAESGNVPLLQTEKTLPVATAPAELPGLEKPKAPTKRKHALPADWKPTESHAAKAQSLNVSVEHEAEKFRLHAGATGRLMQNWDLAFHSWLLNARPMAQGGTVTAVNFSSGGFVTPPAPRFPVVQPGQYDPNYLQPRTPEQLANDEAEMRVAREQLLANRDRNRQQR